MNFTKNQNHKQNHNNNLHNYDLNEKKLLIDYIYSNINISKFKYKLLETYDDLENFQESKKFYISANFSGTNYLLVFCKIKNKTYSFMIDRKTMSFNSEQIKYENINIMPVNIKLENSIYDGTIIDGIYIKHDKKKEKFFVITDLYMFRGITTEKDKINMKLLNIETYLDYNMKSCQNFILTINKLYELENIDKLVNNDIKKTHDFHVRGLSFYPEISATKLIYVFNDDKDKKILNKNNDLEIIIKENKIKNDSINLINSINPINPINTNIRESKKTKIKYSVKSEFKNQEIIFVLELKKTEISDVYKLFAVEEVNKDDKKILRTKKMGIAYIPTKDISLKCKEIFNKNVNGRALFRCKFDDNKNKWLPIDEIKNVKIPNKINEIEMKLEIIEETDSDSE